MEDDKLLMPSLDRSFRSTCRVLFGKEIGGLEECKWLFGYAKPPAKGKSALSNKEVFFTEPYGKDSRLVSLSEKQLVSAPKFSPNDIKDIDSLLRAARETAYYCGNKAIGNSGHIALCDNIADSFFIYSSHNVNKSEYIAYSELVIKSKHIFGSSAAGESEFCIGISDSSLAHRVFESAQIQTCSDLHCCFFMKDCRECMFSFAQQAKMFMVGNNQLERAGYLALKKNLVSQMAEALRSKKKGLLLSEIVGAL